MAVATAAAAGGAALGFGALVSVAATTAAADITGMLMAGVLATLGFLVIPARRRRARREMRDKISALRERLGLALRTEFDRAQQQSADRIAQAVDPYRRFVLSEQQRWAEARTALRDLSDAAAAFRARLSG